ncbi:D-alanyl-D-alanine carboxypeptidase [Actinopolyspora lacussalsi subsp. righensis]|uniref:D-alanyl-D-alanine carboxypeptidase n=1 Tax=Actinopolyspora righensis TaxID=995060 RepID=A0A1I7CC89_9ACTN|nr:serine hydrolase domain-containing protein [Actinopolyspora righensis]SFT97039.1 D-alanyl-D-alanine carboxypeptidase [Actinopolyspora righensis]
MNGTSGLRRGLTAVGLAAMVALPGSVTAVAATAPISSQHKAAEAGSARLGENLEAVHEAGMPGIQAAVSRKGRSWTGAAGVADTHTDRPLEAGFGHRVGSVTKTFTATAVLRQVSVGRVELDAPIGRYLPELVPGERGERITVRMLLNHTSGITDYFPVVFSSLTRGSLADLERNRFRYHSPEELITAGLEQPATNEPGQGWAYSNTNYIIAGELLREVTGQSPERYITREIIRPLGLRDTYFPRLNPFIPGPNSKAYEALYHQPERRGEYSVYSPTALRAAGALISTPTDLNRFYDALLGGELLDESLLAEMRETVAVPNSPTLRYGLGLMRFETPACGAMWGHEGTVPGMSTLSLHSADGKRQLSYGLNLTKYQRLDENGLPLIHAIDRRLGTLQVNAVCGASGTASTASPSGSEVALLADLHRLNR